MMTNCCPPVFVIDARAENLKLVGIAGEQGYGSPGAAAQMALRSANAHPPDLVLLDIGYRHGWLCSSRRRSRLIRGRRRAGDLCSAPGETFDKVRAFTSGGVISSPSRSTRTRCWRG
jgi:hypothetical protein